MPKFRVTYDVVTPESAEHGDTAEAGFASPGGWRHDDPAALSLRDGSCRAMSGQRRASGQRTIRALPGGIVMLSSAVASRRAYSVTINAWLHCVTADCLSDLRQAIAAGDEREAYRLARLAYALATGTALSDRRLSRPPGEAAGIPFGATGAGRRRRAERSTDHETVITDT